MASLQIEGKPPKGGKGDSQKTVSVMIQHDKSEFLLCTLDHVKKYQQFLDLNFTEGEEITFFLNGEGVVHLTGYILEDFGSKLHGDDDECYSFEGSSDDDDDDDFEMDDEEEEDDDSDESDVPKLKAITAGDEDSEESESDEDAKPKAQKRKIKESDEKQKKKLKIIPSDSEDDDDDDDDDDVEFDSDDYNFLVDEAEDSEDEDEESEESSDEEIKMKLAKKNDKKTPQKADVSKKQENVQTPVNKNEPPSESAKKSKKKKKKERQEALKSPGTNVQKTPNTNTPKISQQQQQQKTPTSSKILGTPKTGGSQQQQTADSTKKNEKKKPKSTESQQNGNTPAGSAKKQKKKIRAGETVTLDAKEGVGPEAKHGKMVHVFYKGCLENGKQFDACLSGKPFAFRLGKGEVIKGWDTGVLGMKVGGKRKVIVPASQGYGSKKIGNIPPNSTLVFDIELKAVT